MEQLKLKATRRIVLGKKNRFLRRQGQTPAHLFGHSIESQSLQCDAIALKKIVDHAGTTRLVSLSVEGDKSAKSVFVREIQRDVLTRQLLHVDFYQIRKDEKMTMTIPIVLYGEAPALKVKNRMLIHGTTELSIECLPENVPPQINVDISVLDEVEQSIFIKDIVIDPEITVHTDPEQLVVKISEINVGAEEIAEAAGEGAEAEGAEGAAEEGAEAPAEGTASG
ncbi:MAG: 50S ribosomal protein L25 [Dehalococcoidales bacterium]|nr:50S ribosomal protein L25 [Dehalococcoidales bacterium]